MVSAYMTIVAANLELLLPAKRVEKSLLMPLQKNYYYASCQCYYHDYCLLTTKTEQGGWA